MTFDTPSASSASGQKRNSYLMFAPRHNGCAGTRLPVCGNLYSLPPKPPALTAARPGLNGATSLCTKLSGSVPPSAAEILDFRPHFRKRSSETARTADQPRCCAPDQNRNLIILKYLIIVKKMFHREPRGIAVPWSCQGWRHSAGGLVSTPLHLCKTARSSASRINRW